MSEAEHVLELLPEFALGALDTDQTRLVLEHVQHCTLCRAELEQYSELAERMAYAVPTVAPPQQVKASLLQKLPARGGRAKTNARAARQVHWRNLFQRAWTPVSLVLIFLLGLSTLYFYTQSNAQQGEETFRLISLQAAPNFPQAYGVIIVNDNGEQGTLVVDGLPRLPEEQQYQLWLLKDGKRVSGGVFSVNRKGYGSLWVYAPQPLASYTEFGITIEPQGGSPGPTGERVLGGGS